MKAIHWVYLLLLLGSLGLATSAHASDRIFADGFEPCCRIGGTVSGLTGSGLDLHLSAGAVNENQPIAANGLYDFANPVPPGTAYSVSIGTQPSGQTCSVSHASGTVGSAPIDDIDVTCGAIPHLLWDSGTWGQLWN